MAADGKRVNDLLKQAGITNPGTGYGPEHTNYVTKRIEIATAIEKGKTDQEILNSIKASSPQTAQQATQATSAPLNQNEAQDQINSEIDPSTRDAMILALYKREPERALYIAKQLGSPLAKTLKAKEVSEIDSVTENIIKTIFRAEATVAQAADSVTSPIVSGINSFSNSLTQGITEAKLNLNKALTPVSRATGEVLTTATKVLENPLGAPFVIGESIGHLIDKVSPGFTNRLDAAYKKLGVENISHFPAQVVGSLKQLMSAASSVACLPISLIGELNQALLEISNAISRLIDKVQAAVYDFFFGPQGVLDSILPLDSINEFLSTVSDLATTVGAIATLAGGSASFLSNLGQVNGFIGSATATFSNPARLASAYLNTGSVGQVLNTIRNPQGVLNQLIPPKVSDKLNKLNQFCSIAQSGDLGFAFSAFLGPVKGRALQYLLTKYGNKSASVKPLLNQKPTAEEIPKEVPPTLVTPVVGTKQEDKVTGVPTVVDQKQTRPEPLLPEKQTSTNSSEPEELALFPKIK
jgi:hypothetical protein